MARCQSHKRQCAPPEIAVEDMGASHGLTPMSSGRSPTSVLGIVIEPIGNAVVVWQEALVRTSNKEVQQAPEAQCFQALCRVLLGPLHRAEFVIRS